MGLNKDYCRNYFSMEILYLLFISTFIIINTNTQPHQNLKIETGSYSTIADTTKHQKRGSQISVHQTGSGNTATVRQSGSPGEKTEATVKMTGSGNITDISFGGAHGDTVIEFAGEDNLLLIRPLPVFDIFTLQFGKNHSATNDNDESARNYLLIFRNLEESLEIHQQSANTLSNPDDN